MNLPPPVTGEGAIELDMAMTHSPNSVTDAGNARGDMLAGIRQGVLIGAAALALVLPPNGFANRHVARVSVPPVAATVEQRSIADPLVATSDAAAAPQPVRLANFAAVQPTEDVKFIADWIADSRDNAGMAFAILDKRDARVYVFDRDARLVDASPVLLGAAAGDDSVDGIGQRPINEVRPEERTTPAGRFISAPGRNAGGEDVVWVDYDAAVSMHRVRPVDPKERRLERLASHDPLERRISYGCINVPPAFFNHVVQPTLGHAKNVVYVLPERKALAEVFTAAYPPAERVAAGVAAAPGN